MNNAYKKLAVAFTGPSNSGKTTLIIKLSNELQKLGFKVAIVKHDPEDKAQFDKEGKDSYNFSRTSADVAVVSPKRTTLFKTEESSIDEIVSMFNDFDYLLVEGLKTLPLPRICVCREKIHDSYLDFSNAIALGTDIIDNNIKNTIDILDLNNLNQIITWINNNAKNYKDK